MVGRVWAMLKDQSGPTAIEYALIAAIISVGALIGYNALGGGVFNMYELVRGNVVNAIQSAGH